MFIVVPLLETLLLLFLQFFVATLMRNMVLVETHFVERVTLASQRALSNFLLQAVLVCFRDAFVQPVLEILILINSKSRLVTERSEISLGNLLSRETGIPWLRQHAISNEETNSGLEKVINKHF